MKTAIEELEDDINNLSSLSEGSKALLKILISKSKIKEREQTKELQEQLAAKEKEWISVEDDLKPDFYVKVLMEVSSDDTNYYDIGSYTRDGWHSHLRKLPNVIKWKYIN